MSTPAIISKKRPVPAHDEPITDANAELKVAVAAARAAIAAVPPVPAAAPASAPAAPAPPPEVPSEDEEESEKVSSSLAIAPGLHLPNTGGVYLLDTYNGELQLTELSQSSGEMNRRTGHNILRGAIVPLTSSKSVELKGEHARTQSHLQQPAIFLDIDQDPGGKSLALAERFRIARLEPKKDARVVGSLKVAITGKVSQQEFYLPATAEQLPGGWVRLIPSQPLSPGEYAVVEMLDRKTMNLYVWDFGVDPSSPENPGVWKAAPSLPAGTAAITPR